jgi:hypothetical protein
MEQRERRAVDLRRRRQRESRRDHSDITMAHANKKRSAYFSKRSL